MSWFTIYRLTYSKLTLTFSFVFNLQILMFQIDFDLILVDVFVQSLKRNQQEEQYHGKVIAELYTNVTIVAIQT